MRKKNMNREDIEEYITITEEDDDVMVDIKTRLRELKPMERKIFLTYTELGTFAATAREFNVSPPTIKTYINNIKEKILCI